MTSPYYSPDVTRFSREVMDGIRQIHDETRAISLLGGWAVYHLVDPNYANESQDIDVLIHAPAALDKLVPFLLSKKYAWRWIRSGEARSRDNCFTHEYHKDMLVDAYFSGAFGDDAVRKLFATRWVHAIKDHPYEGFVPSARTTLKDKLETLPKRTDKSKAVKDAIDAHALLFHNRDGTSAKDLVATALPEARGVLAKLPALRTIDARYTARLDDLAAFIERAVR